MCLNFYVLYLLVSLTKLSIQEQSVILHFAPKNQTLYYRVYLCYRKAFNENFFFLLKTSLTNRSIYRILPILFF